MSDQPTNAHRTLFDNVMVKAWSDPAFKSKLLTDPSAALATFDARLPAGMVMKVVENTENLDHLVIPMRPAGDLSDENIAEATGIRLDSATGGSAHFMPFCKWCPFCLGLIRKAWSDPAFKAQLLTDPRAAVTATGADVRKDEECTDTVGVYLHVDAEGKAHIRMTLGPEVQTLTRAMTAILCKGLDGATPQEILDLQSDFVTRIVGTELVRVRSQTVYYVLTRIKSICKVWLDRQRMAQVT